MDEKSASGQLEYVSKTLSPGKYARVLAHRSGANARSRFEIVCGLAMTLIASGYLATVSLAVSLGLHRRQGRRGRESVASWIGFGLGAHLLLEWSLAGFYDGLAVAPMCLAAYAWRNGRAARALLWYGISTFMHFRGLWLLPLGVAACWRFMAGWSAGAVDGRQRREGLVGLLLGGCAALSLAWVGPWLVHFPANHVLQVAMISEWYAVHLAQLGSLTAVACAMCLGVNRMLGPCALVRSGWRSPHRSRCRGMSWGSFPCSRSSPGAR